MSDFDYEGRHPVEWSALSRAIYDACKMGPPEYPAKTATVMSERERIIKAELTHQAQVAKRERQRAAFKPLKMARLVHIGERAEPSAAELARCRDARDSMRRKHEEQIEASFMDAAANWGPSPFTGQFDLTRPLLHRGSFVITEGGGTVRWRRDDGTMDEREMTALERRVLLKRGLDVGAEYRVPVRLEWVDFESDET